MKPIKWLVSKWQSLFYKALQLKEASTDIQRYVAKRNKNHQSPFVIHYHIPKIGVITADGATEEEADKAARIKGSEAITKVYTDKMKELMELEKLLEFR